MGLRPGALPAPLGKRRMCLCHWRLHFQHPHSLPHIPCKVKQECSLACRKPCIQSSAPLKQPPGSAPLKSQHSGCGGSRISSGSSSLHIELAEALKAAPTPCLGSEQRKLLKSSFPPTFLGAVSIRNPGTGVITNSPFQEPTCPRWQRPFKTAVIQHPHC